MTDLEIRSKLAIYLAGKLTKQQFQEWLIAATWDIDQSPDEKLRQLVYTIELAFAENHSGHLPDDELKKELIPLVRSFTTKLVTGSNKVFIATGTSSASIAISTPVRLGDRSLAKVLS